MVDAGEKGGLLADILARLATYLESTARMRKKIKSAMMYPTIVTIVALGITIFLLTYVVPVFGEVFKGFGAELPAPTQFLVTVGIYSRNISGTPCPCSAWLFTAVLLHQDQGGPGILGSHAHQTAGVWLDCP